MNTRPRNSGFVLMFALCLLGFTTVIVGALMAYITFSLRLSQCHLDKTVCRLAAQSGIEHAKAHIFTGFKKSSFKGRELVGVSASGDFTWFGQSTTLSRSVGTRNPITLDDYQWFNGCRVYTRIGRVEPRNNSADVVLVAKAVLPAANAKSGRETATCIREKIRFAQGRSKVFDHAYFVNNYGWFQGSGCTANGDVRANGDMYLDSSCKVNGNVYAVKNEDLDVPGEITNYGKMDNRSTYKSTTYGTANRARPLDVDGGYNAPSSVSTSTYKNRLYDQDKMEQLYPGQTDFRITMPYISDLQDYVNWSTDLHAEDSSLGTIKQGSKTLATIQYNGPGPSGLTEVKETVNGKTVTKLPSDYNSLVLVGTQTNPIKINGPVIVPGDVIIKGYVTGQGTIYCGRNIHVVGSIKYVNPPTWANKAVSANSNNSQKDLVGFMAKGNIVMGDYTQSTWHSGIDSYLSTDPYVQEYACDASDAGIGYPATFGGSYLNVEKVPQLDSSLAADAPGGYDSASGQFGKLRETTVGTGTYHQERVAIKDKWGRTSGYQNVQVEDTKTVLVNVYNRKYYESVCKDTEVSSRCEEITQLDGVFYNNHGIFGKLGDCTVNGSLVCRNEGLQYSSKLYLNWDYRLYSGSSETVDNDRVGLAKTSGLPPATLSWQEVPVSLFDHP